jgi:hypothetical protein
MGDQLEICKPVGFRYVDDSSLLMPDGVGGDVGKGPSLRYVIHEQSRLPRRERTTVTDTQLFGSFYIKLICIRAKAAASQCTWREKGRRSPRDPSPSIHRGAQKSIGRLIHYISLDRMLKPTLIQKNSMPAT